MSIVKRVGVINWDCALPSTTFFGSYAAQSLGELRFRDRTPYYAIDLGDGKINFPERTQESYDGEMQYAIDAGIDYFAYCWYDREPHLDHVDTSDAATVDAHVCELVGARMKHLKSPLRNKLHLCAILINSHPYTDEELRDLARIMQQECYEKIDGHPMVFFYVAPWTDVQERLRKFCQEVGSAEPFCIAMTWGEPPAPETDIDALSAYAFGMPTRTYEELMDGCLQANAVRASGSFPTIPLFTMGWNPQPRIDHPVPWCKYPAVTYAPKASSAQLLEAAKRLKDWMKENPSAARLGHVMTFAWNEFEEGAWICPTLDAPDALNLERVKTFREIADFWRKHD